MFRNELRHLIFMATSIPHPWPDQFKAGDRATVRFSFQNQLAPSHYLLTPAVGKWEDAYEQLEQREEVASLIVESGLETGGVVDLPTKMEIVRS
jgi:Wzt C-terminal domain